MGCVYLSGDSCRERSNIIAALPYSLLLSRADRDGIVCLSVQSCVVSH